MFLTQQAVKRRLYPACPSVTGWIEPVDCLLGETTVLHVVLSIDEENYWAQSDKSHLTVQHAIL